MKTKVITNIRINTIIQHYNYIYLKHYFNILKLYIFRNIINHVYY